MEEVLTHKPVLLEECIQALNIRPDGIYLDGTLGRAGHSREIARRLTTGRLICVDRDQAALDAAQERLGEWMDKVTLVHSNFDQLDAILDGLHLAGVDGMLFDLGVSSPQLDDGARGFSYRTDAPLDMRMDQSEGLTAAQVVNTWPQEELRRILSQYGEERYAPTIAAAIVRRRQERPIETTLELVDVIKSGMPARALKEKQHPAKRSFQAIRIAVNDELSSVDRMIPLAGGPDRENRPGRLCKRLYLSARLPGVCVREDPGRETDFPKAHSAHGGGDRGKPPGPERQAAGGGEAQAPGKAGLSGQTVGYQGETE